MKQRLWDASVLEVWADGDTFTARLYEEGGPELLAEFSMKHCGITVEPGDLLIITPEKVIRRDLGKWTEAELERIRQRAHEHYEALKDLIG